MSNLASQISRGGVEDTRLEAKDTKKNPRLRPRPRTALLRTDPIEAKDRNVRGKAKDQGHRRKCSSKKKKRKVFKNFFQAKKVFKKIFFQAISNQGKQKRSLQIFREVSGVFQQNFNGSKNSALLEPRTGQFSRT